MTKLTRREKEIFTLLLEGLVPKEIAEKLKISYDTVLSHQKKLYSKLDVHSIEELLEKYRNNKDEIIVSNGNNQHNLIKQFFQRKILIATGIAAILLVFILIGVRYFAKPSIFTTISFGEVYLKATRWVNRENEWYGEQYKLSASIRLSDIYNGTLDELIPYPHIRDFLRVKVSGTVDKEIKALKVDLNYYPERYQCIPIGYSEPENSVSIGPGDFSVIISIHHIGTNINTLPEGGEFLFDIADCLYLYDNNDGRFIYIFDSGERIPDDMPQNKIWATINNLKIEPLDRLAR